MSYIYIYTYIYIIYISYIYIIYISHIYHICIYHVYIYIYIYRRAVLYVLQNITEITLTKSISREDAHYSSDALFANLDKMLNKTLNQRQEDRKQHSTDEENDIENDKGNQFGIKTCAISPKNVLRVSYAEISKQPIRKRQSCDSSDYQDIIECDLTQGNQSYLEALQSLGDPFEHDVLSSWNRMAGSFVSNHVFNLNKKRIVC